MRIAFLGLGLMGVPMASRLCRAGLAVHVWNRSTEKTAPLMALGAHAHLSALDAVGSADLTITMLEHGGIVELVLFERSANPPEEFQGVLLRAKMQ